MPASTPQCIGAAMTARASSPRPCQLYDTDGRLLSAGWCAEPAPSPEGEVTVSGLDRPGSVVRYCLLDGGRDVLLQVGQGPRVPMKVLRVSFDPRRGRICILRQATAPGMPSTVPPSGSCGEMEPLQLSRNTGQTAY